MLEPNARPPALDHETVGWGMPVALQIRFSVDPWETTTFSSPANTTGGMPTSAEDVKKDCQNETSHRNEV